MTRTRAEIQDANALLKAMHVFLVANNMTHLFGDAINTIAAAIDEIHEEKQPTQGIGLDNLQRRFQ
jgi:hypothetical protein